MDESKKAGFTFRMLWRYEKENTTCICSIHEHQEDMAERKCSHWEEIDVKSISCEASSNLQFWDLGTNK